MKNYKFISKWLPYTSNISFSIHVHKTVPQTIYQRSPNATTEGDS